jgi:hypothetical protein
MAALARIRHPAAMDEPGPLTASISHHQERPELIAPDRRDLNADPARREAQARPSRTWGAGLARRYSRLPERSGRPCRRRRSRRPGGAAFRRRQERRVHRSADRGISSRHSRGSFTSRPENSQPRQPGCRPASAVRSRAPMRSSPQLPSSSRLALGGVVVALLWGLCFGWLEGDLWSLRNWFGALAAGALWVVVLAVLVRTRWFHR